MNRSRVLVLDIETSLMLVYTFGIKDQYIAPSDIHTDWHILSFGAKWLDNKKFIYHETRNGNDKQLLKPLWNLLNEADIVLTQNGQEFDAKKINSRFMLHGFKKPKPYVHFDTYQLVRKVASFTSNSLAYLTSKFCVEHKKESHKKYPGKQLWIECFKGNPDAYREMKKYNRKDVLSLEELYTKIRAWAPETFPRLFNLTDTSSECGTCGYQGQMREGNPRRTKLYVYQQHSCPKCGAWQKGKKIKETGK